MLEQLFGSNVRRKMLEFFLMHIGESFTFAALKNILGRFVSEKEIQNLISFGVLQKEWRVTEISLKNPKKKNLRKNRVKKETKEIKEAVYRVNTEFPLLPELKSLVLKSIIFWEQHLVKKLKSLGSISYLAFTGFFTDDDGVSTDMLIVGRLGKTRLARIMRKFQSEIHRSIRYTALSKKEFEYRMDITDRFLYDLLDSKKIVVIDELINKNTD
ncbi:MAG TPA: hypothetical protein VJC11_02325 [Patescibacteria group bacterium]|nr:hypothetical protein [Patescibacteria group bacterium]